MSIKRSRSAQTSPNTGGGLNARQRLFIAEYLVDKNATKAAIRAGYSAATAGQIGSRLLKHVEISTGIKQLIEQQLAQVTHETGITLERTLREIARIGYFDPRRMFGPDGRPLNITELDDDVAAAISGLDVVEQRDEVGGVIGYVKKWKLADKKGGLDMLMRHLGGYKNDNEQGALPVADALRAFFAHLHNGAGRLPIVPRPPDAA